MSKRTNLDLKDAACLHVFHLLQHPTSRPKKSTQTTMVNAQKKNFRHLWWADMANHQSRQPNNIIK
jgi:hypothetical protein